MRALFVRVFAFAIAASTLLLVAAPARAQSIGLPQIVYREQPLRPYNQLPTWINYADCKADDKLSFTLTITGYVGSGGNQYSLQGWAGTASCKDPAARTGTNPTCWLVYSQTPPANVTNYTVVLDAQQLVGMHKTTGSAPTVPLPASAADCDTGTGGHQQLTIDFMFVDTNNTIVGSAAEYTLGGFDITPPQPPTGVTLGLGDTRLTVDWTSGGDADLVEFRMYCVPYPGGSAGQVSTDGGPGVGTLSQAIEAGAPATGGATAAGGAPATGGATAAGGTTATGGATGAGAAFGTDAGSGGGLSGAGGSAGLAQTSCDPASVLVPGGIPDDQYRCGTADKASSEGTVSGLTNGVTYVVAVAAVDSVGNPGRLSANVCGAPVTEIDFFELYREAGGTGGGGICSVTAIRPTPVSTWLLSLLGVFVGAGVARRIRRRS